MNNLQMKEWRSVQIAANILYRLCGNISIENTNYAQFDFIVTLLDSNIRFAVKVGSSSFIKNVGYEKYKKELSKLNFDNRSSFIPIILMCVNESAETAVWGFQVGWWCNKKIIINKVKLRLADTKSWSALHDHLKAIDSTIRLLSDTGIKIIKKIEIEKSSTDGKTSYAEIIYFRDFTDIYKMKSTTSTTDENRFQRLLYGIPEEEYPSDTLDSIIATSVSKVYRITRIDSKLLLFSTDLSDLQIYHNIDHLEGHILITPDISQIPNNLLAIFEKVEMPYIVFDIFIKSFIDHDEFQETNFSHTIPINEWIEQYNEISRAIGTLHRINEFLQ